MRRSPDGSDPRGQREGRRAREPLLRDDLAFRSDSLATREQRAPMRAPAASLGVAQACPRAHGDDGTAAVSMFAASMWGDWQRQPQPPPQCDQSTVGRQSGASLTRGGAEPQAAAWGPDCERSSHQKYADCCPYHMHTNGMSAGRRVEVDSGSENRKGQRTSVRGYATRDAGKCRRWLCQARHRRACGARSGGKDPGRA